MCYWVERWEYWEALSLMCWFLRYWPPLAMMRSMAWLTLREEWIFMVIVKNIEIINKQRGGGDHLIFIILNKQMNKIVSFLTLIFMKKYSSSSNMLSASLNYPLPNIPLNYTKHDSSSYSISLSNPPNHPLQHQHHHPHKRQKEALERSENYEALKDKITNLEERLGNIRKNYDMLETVKLKKNKPKANDENRILRSNRYGVQSPKYSLKNKLSQEIPLPKRYPIYDEEDDINCYITKLQQPPQPTWNSLSQNSLLKSVNNKTFTKTAKSHLYYVSKILQAFAVDEPNSFQELCRNHLLLSVDFANFLNKNNRKMPVSPNPQKLPFSSKQTIIFDLDQTLIHCNESLKMPHDVAISIQFPNKKTALIGINIRPFVMECLKQLRKYFELIVFTASHSCYGNAIINHLDPNDEIFSYRFFREHCYKAEEGYYVKDLRIIDRDLNKVLLIDNAPYSYCFQPENGVPIIPFYDNKADLQLKQLVVYLKSFYGIGNVRKRNEQQMKLSQYRKFTNAPTLISSLYE